MEIETLKGAVIQLAGALVAVRRAVNLVIANQPTLIFSPGQKALVNLELHESIQRVNT
jgi:hypothetical protein